MCVGVRYCSASAFEATRITQQLLDSHTVAMLEKYSRSDIWRSGLSYRLPVCFRAVFKDVSSIDLHKVASTKEFFTLF
jgi:hypothetical protein